MKDTIDINEMTSNKSFLLEGIMLEVSTGIIVSIIVMILIYYRKKLFPNKFDSEPKSNQEEVKIKVEQNPQQTVNLNLNTNSKDESLKSNDISSEPDKQSSSKSKLSPSKRTMIIDSMKSKLKILFIDDDSKFNVVQILKSDGWKKTSTIKDIKGLDIPVVREAEVYFVDINGVGKFLNCEYEGLDLSQMLKEKYSEKKVVIYSANKDQYAFHPAWDICDKKLEKNALPNQFEKIVEDYCIELHFRS